MLEGQRRLLALTGESLYVLPTAIYYEVRHDSAKAMNKCLNHLERLLSSPRIETEFDLSFEQKIKRLVSKFIQHLANLYRVQLVHRESLPAQLRELSKAISTMTARGNGIEFDPSDDETILLHKVRADLKKLPSDICDDAGCSYKDHLKR